MKLPVVVSESGKLVTGHVAEFGSITAEVKERFNISHAMMHLH